MNKEKREESWNFIDLLADYKRMGVPNNLWVTTAVNSEYRVGSMPGAFPNHQLISISVKRDGLKVQMLNMVVLLVNIRLNL